MPHLRSGTLARPELVDSRTENAASRPHTWTKALKCQLAELRARSRERTVGGTVASARCVAGVGTAAALPPGVVLECREQLGQRSFDRRARRQWVLKEVFRHVLKLRSEDLREFCVQLRPRRRRIARAATQQGHGRLPLRECCGATAEQEKHEGELHLS